MTKPAAMSLTPRQQQVLDGLCAGKNDREIAQDCGISDKAVQFHRLALYGPILGGERNQTKLIATAIRRRMVSRVCLYCGNTIPANIRTFESFCGYNCYRYDWNERNPERRKAAARKNYLKYQEKRRAYARARYAIRNGLIEA